jgi:hypothetical protein
LPPAAETTTELQFEQSWKKNASRTLLRFSLRRSPAGPDAAAKALARSMEVKTLGREWVATRKCRRASLESILVRAWAELMAHAGACGVFPLLCIA